MGGQAGANEVKDLVGSLGDFGVIGVTVCAMHLTSIHWYKTYRTRKTRQVRTCPARDLLLYDLKLISLADKVLRLFFGDHDRQT